MSRNGRHYASKHARRSKNKSKAPKIILIIALIILLAAAALALLYFFGGSTGNENKPVESPSASVSESVSIDEDKTIAENAQISTPETEDTALTLKNGITIEKLGSYTGIFMEDGSDEVVSGIAMLVIKNTGEDYIQYAEITVKSGDTEGLFTLSTLFPGETVVALEKSRKEYKSFGEDYSVEADNVAVFNFVPTLSEDKIKIQPLNGAMNVKNVSGEDIEGDVVIYYKNSASDMYYGGITYRVRITGGIKAGEIKQIITDHFNEKGSKLVFATVG